MTPEFLGLRGLIYFPTNLERQAAEGPVTHDDSSGAGTRLPLAAISLLAAADIQIANPV